MFRVVLSSPQKPITLSATNIQFLTVQLGKIDPTSCATFACSKDKDGQNRNLLKSKDSKTKLKLESFFSAASVHESYVSPLAFYQAINAKTPSPT
jgi:hypothetical protein